MRLYDVEASAGFGASGFTEEVEDQFIFNRQWLRRSLRSPAINWHLSM